MIANFSIGESECYFCGVKRPGTAIQYRRAPTINVRVRRRATQSSLPDSLLERSTAKGSGGNDGIQVKWSCFRVIAPVGVDDRLAAGAQFFLNPSVSVFPF